MPVYSCHPDTTSSENDLYILSVYGNHYAKSTVVDITGEIQEPVTLVLASYYPITWKVKNHEVHIQKIILVSRCQKQKNHYSKMHMLRLLVVKLRICR